jgi:stage IV sporulation protein B
VKVLTYELLRKIIGGILLVSLIAIGFAKPIQEYIHIPKDITVFEGQQYDFSKAAPVSATISSEQSTVAFNDNGNGVKLTGTRPGKEEMMLEIAGFPIKKVDVNVLKDFKIIPGGQSIGVKLNTVGVLVVGHHQVNTSSGKASPGETAGIQVGDIITSINGEKIEKMADVAPFVQDAGESGKSLNITLKREEGEVKT